MSTSDFVRCYSCRKICQQTPELAKLHVAAANVSDGGVQIEKLADILPECVFLICRAVAVGVIAVGSKVAVIAKSAGGASGLLKGAGALAAAGNSHAFRQSCCINLLTPFCCGHTGVNMRTYMASFLATSPVVRQEHDTSCSPEGI